VLSVWIGGGCRNPYRVAVPKLTLNWYRYIEYMLAARSVQQKPEIRELVKWTIP
jgi:hypothetical protein